MRRFLVPIVLVTLLIVAALVLGQRLRKQAVNQSVTFPASGQRLEVLAVLTDDKTFTTETPLQSKLRKWLPAAGSWLPGSTSGSCGAGSNTATLYLMLDPNAPNSPLPWSNYASEDDAGFRYPTEGGYCSFGGTERIYGLGLRAFPRRQADFKVVFLDARGKELGSVRARNPFPGPFPVWQPQALPITQTNGPLALTLESMTLAGDARWPHVEAKWTTAATDPRWRRAKAGWVSLSDSTGNSGSMLSPREPAWRARTLVHRSDRADFAPNEKVLFEGLPVPATNGFALVDQPLENGGVRLRVRALADAGTLYYTNGVPGLLVPGGTRGHGSSNDGQTRVEYWSSEQPFLMLEAHGVSWDDQFLLRLSDAKGGEIQFGNDHSADGLTGGGQMRLCRFTMPTNVTTLTLEVIVSRPLVFEFMVNPADARPARRP